MLILEDTTDNKPCTITKTNQMENQKQNKPINPTLRAMEIGDTVRFPPHQLQSLRNGRTMMQVQLCRKYKISTKNGLTITRIK